MKKILLISILKSLLFTFSAYGQLVENIFSNSGITILQKAKGYSIAGRIKGVPDGTLYYLIRTNENGGADTVAKTRSKNGVFTIDGFLNVAPEIHFMKMDTSVVKVNPLVKTWMLILLDNSHISITGELKDWPNVILEGSKPTVEFDNINMLINTSIKDGNVKLTAAMKELPKDSGKISRIREEVLEKLVIILKSYPDAYATPIITTNLSLIDPNTCEEIYNVLSNRVRNSFYGIRLKKHFSSLYKSRQITKGSIIPAVSILSSSGKEISILEEVAKNKITLIDFWASWCKPCREEIPNLLKVYNAFHKKGFNIIGVSSDTKKSAWEKAMLEDKTPWIHGLEKEDSRIGKEIFRLQSIPAFVLIDSSGKLLAFERGLSSIPAFGPNIQGEKLYETIERLLDEMERKGDSGK